MSLGNLFDSDAARSAKHEQTIQELLLARKLVVSGQVGVINGGTDLPVHIHDADTHGGATLKPTNLRLAAASALTIAAGVITATQTHHTIDTEAAAATDDLDTINGLVAGQLYLFRPVNDARTVVVRHAVGNIKCVGNGNISLDDIQDLLWVLSPDGVTAYAMSDVGATGPQGLPGAAGVAGPPGPAGEDGDPGSGGGGGSGGGHAIYDEVTPLTTQASLRFRGGGVVAANNATTGATDVYVAPYYDAIVDDAEPGAGNGNIYATEQAAIDAWHSSILFRHSSAAAARSRLSADITATGTTISLVDASAFPAAGYALIEKEVIHYTSKSGNDLIVSEAVGTGRGAKGTTNVGHTQDSNTATGGSTTTLVRSTATWATNEHKGKLLVMTSGLNNGLSRIIVSNTGTTLTVEAAFPNANANGDTYRIDNKIGTTAAIGSGDACVAIYGEEAVNAKLPVHLSVQKADFNIQFVQFTTQDSDITRLVFQAVRCVAFACAFALQGRLELYAADCEAIAIRAVACSITPVLVGNGSSRARVTAGRFLEGSGTNDIAIDNVTLAGIPTGCAIVGNTFQHTTMAAGFVISTWNFATAGSTGHQIAGNTIIGCDNGGIRLYGRFHNISGNSIDGVTQRTDGTVTQKGLYLNGLSSVILSGNTIRFCQYAVESVAGLASGGSFVLHSANMYLGTSTATATTVICGDDNFLVGCFYVDCIVNFNSRPGITVASGIAYESGYQNIAGDTVIRPPPTTLGTLPSGATAFGERGVKLGRSYVGSQASVTVANGRNDNVNVAETADVYFIGPTAAYQMSGISAGEDGRILYVYNGVAQTASLNHQDVNSAVANRIITPTGAAINFTSALLKYNLTLTKWIVVTYW